MEKNRRGGARSWGSNEVGRGEYFPRENGKLRKRKTSAGSREGSPVQEGTTGSICNADPALVTSHSKGTVENRKGEKTGPWTQIGKRIQTGGIRKRPLGQNTGIKKKGSGSCTGRPKNGKRKKKRGEPYSEPENSRGEKREENAQKKTARDAPSRNKTGTAHRSLASATQYSSGQRRGGEGC